MTRPGWEKQVIEHGKARGNILTILQGLQKLYQHPRLLAPAAVRGDGGSIERAIEESPKLAACLDILRGIREVGEKALVFTLWTEMQALLADAFKSQLGLQRVRIINGDPKQRSEAQDYIRSRRSEDSMCSAEPLAAAQGYDHRGEQWIHTALWIRRRRPATDRAYRIGQSSR